MPRKRRSTMPKHNSKRPRPLAGVFPQKITKKPRTKTIMVKLHKPFSRTPLQIPEMMFESNEENTTEIGGSSGGGNDSSSCSSFIDSWLPSLPLVSFDYEVPGPIPDFNELLMDANDFLNFFADIPEIPD